MQMPIHTQFHQMAIWTSKVGQDDLVFDVRSGFASGSVRARLQVSDSGYDLCHPGCKFSDRRSAGSRDTAHKYFCDRL